jgi:hypothetical protein
MFVIEKEQFSIEKLPRKRNWLKAQGFQGSVLEGVQLAGLPGLGSGSPVFLIHTEFSGRMLSAWRGLGGRKGFRRAPAPKTGCYHRRSVNVL